MPGLQELIGVLFVVAVVWFVIKLARVAVRLIVFVIAHLLLLGVLFLVFVR
jgi:hypothetical protein